MSRVAVEQCDGGYKIVMPDASDEQKSKYAKYLNHVYKHKHVAVSRSNDIAKTLD